VCIGLCATTLPIQAAHMVYDPSRDRLYLTVPGVAANYPNTITAVDPGTATVAAATPIGSDPDVLALSVDGSTLWVGIDGAFAIRKLTLTGTTPVAGSLHPLPTSTTSAYAAATAIVPQSDSPDTVAVLGGSPPLAVYDDGVPRPNPNATNVVPSTIFAGPPGMFFGTSSVGATATLFELRVLPTGIAQATFPDVLGNVGGKGLYLAGRLYIQNKVIDVSNPSLPVAAGTLPDYGPISAHASPNRLIMLSTAAPGQADDSYQLRLLDTDSLTQRGSVAVPKALLTSSLSDNISEIAYAGSDKVAVLVSSLGTVSSRLVILRAPLLANDGVDPNAGAGGRGGGSGGVVGTGGTGTGGAGGAVGADGLCAGCTLHQVDAPGFHMVFDPVHGRLYTVLTYDAPHDPNALVSIDVATETVLATVPIDKTPRQMALSDDGASLWLGFDDVNTIRRVSVAATPPVTGPAYDLPPYSLGAGMSQVSRPYDLVALPGATGSIAACISGAATSRVAVMDDGVARATIDDSRYFTSKLAAGPAGILFGYDGMSSAYTFTSYSVTADGVTLLAAREGLLGVYQNDIHYYQGRIYADWGEVLDVSDPAHPLRAGKFAFNGIVTPRSTTRVLMLAQGKTSLELKILDAQAFTQIAALPLGTKVGNSTFGIADLVYLGGDAVAFLSTSGARGVFILHSPAIATPP